MSDQYTPPPSAGGGGTTDTTARTAAAAAQNTANSAKIVSKSADYAILAADTGVQFTGAHNFTLPAAVAVPGSGFPLRFGFLVPASGTLTVTPAAGDAIQYGALAGAAAGALSNANFGASFWLVNSAIHQWVVEKHSGPPSTITQ